MMHPRPHPHPGPPACAPFLYGLRRFAFAIILQISLERRDMCMAAAVKFLLGRHPSCFGSDGGLNSMILNGRRTYRTLFHHRIGLRFLWFVTRRPRFRSRYCYLRFEWNCLCHRASAVILQINQVDRNLSETWYLLCYCPFYSHQDWMERNWWWFPVEVAALLIDLVHKRWAAKRGDFSGSTRTLDSWNSGTSDPLEKLDIWLIELEPRNLLGPTFMPNQVK